jgi:hypothetical protein
VAPERLAVAFEERARAAVRLPLAERDGCSAILAVRSWEFSAFTRLRRGGGFRGNRLVQSTAQRAAPK